MDPIIDLLARPAGVWEERTGRSIHVVTLGCYTVGLASDVAETGIITQHTLFGNAQLFGMMLLTMAIWWLWWFGRRTLAAAHMAGKGPTVGQPRQALSADRIDPVSRFIRRSLTMLLVISVVTLIGGFTRNDPDIVSMATRTVTTFATWLALHLHACSPKGGTPSQSLVSARA